MAGMAVQPWIMECEQSIWLGRKMRSIFQRLLQGISSSICHMLPLSVRSTIQFHLIQTSADLLPKLGVALSNVLYKIGHVCVCVCVRLIHCWCNLPGLMDGPHARTLGEHVTGERMRLYRSTSLCSDWSNCSERRTEDMRAALELRVWAVLVKPNYVRGINRSEPEKRLGASTRCNIMPAPF